MGELSGVRVVVTRAANQAQELVKPLRDLGADVLLLPLLSISPPLNAGPLQRAAADIVSYDLVIFTSANAVRALRDALKSSVNLSSMRVAAIGTATRDAAQAAGFCVAIVPARYQAEDLLDTLGAESLAGRRVLIPSSDLARDLIPETLRRRGAIVDKVEAYCNIRDPSAADNAQRLFQAPLPDWVLLASPSALHHLLSVVDADVLGRVKLASIGNVTSDAIRAAGLPVTVQAEPQTAAGLVEAIANFYR